MTTRKFQEDFYSIILQVRIVETKDFHNFEMQWNLETLVQFRP